MNFTRELKNGMLVFSLIIIIILVASYVRFQQFNADSAGKVENTYLENNQTHILLGSVDSYFHLRQAENLEKLGTLCEEMREGKCYDTLSLAPHGRETFGSIHPYAIVFFHKILGTFNKHLNIMDSVFDTQAILACIISIIIFFIGKILFNNVAGFFAALAITTNPAFIQRTIQGGHDIWAILIISLCLLALIHYEKLRQGWQDPIKIFSLSAIMLLSIFSWRLGWWYFYDILLISFAAAILLKTTHYFLNKKRTIQVKPLLKSALIFFLVNALIITTFYSLNTYLEFVSSPLEYAFGDKLTTSQNTIWPNALSNVAELKKIGLQQSLQYATGSSLILLLAAIGLIITFFHLKEDKKILPLLFLIFTALIGLTASLLGGIRFAILLAPSVAIFFGIAIGKCYESTIMLIHEKLKPDKKQNLVINIALISILCLLLIVPLSTGLRVAKSTTPLIDNGWYTLLSQVNKNTSQEAIINSWWDYGHWYTYIAKRRVSVDGATQNMPETVWISRAITSDNEQESLAILRMLNCGGNTAYQLTNLHLKDEEKSYHLIIDILSENKEKAALLLEKNDFSPEEAESILKNTHCNPPESYLLLYEDLAPKSQFWAYYGLWNFTKAKMYEGQDSLISSQPEYLTKEFLPCTVTANILVCQSNKTYIYHQNILRIKTIHLDLKNASQSYIEGIILLEAHNSTFRYPIKTIISLEGNDLKYVSSSSNGLGAFIKKESSANYVILADNPLTTSLFSRLVFMNGAETQHFEKAIETLDRNGKKIQLWKINY